MRGVGAGLIAFAVAMSIQGRVVAAPSFGAACVVGAHPAELGDWALYAATLTCDSLRAKGVSVGQPVSSAEGAPAAFTVTLARLGPAFTVLVTYEAPPGSRRSGFWAHLNTPEEFRALVPRFATALTTPALSPGPSAPEPNLAAESEARREEVPRKWQWYIGLEGGFVHFPAAADSGSLIGAILSFEFGHFGIALEGHFASAGGPEPSYTSEGSLGGRYYFSEKTTSLFVGGGPTRSSITDREGTDTSTGLDFCIFSCSSGVHPGTLDGAGYGAYAEAGVMIRRRIKIPMALSLRGDFPFYRVKRQIPDWVDASLSTGPTSRYETPVSLNFTVGF